MTDGIAQLCQIMAEVLRDDPAVAEAKLVGEEKGRSQRLLLTLTRSHLQQALGDLHWQLFVVAG